MDPLGPLELEGQGSYHHDFRLLASNWQKLPTCGPFLGHRGTLTHGEGRRSSPEVLGVQMLEAAEVPLCLSQNRGYPGLTKEEQPETVSVSGHSLVPRPRDLGTSSSELWAALGMHMTGGGYLPERAWVLQV